jgi:hypothetical protein
MLVATKTSTTFKFSDVHDLTTASSQTALEGKTCVYEISVPIQTYKDPTTLTVDVTFVMESSIPPI